MNLKPSFLLCLISTVAFAQSGQIDISRVQSMPNMPSPYIMRDWKDVAIRYDSIIYSLSATGQYLPVMHLKASGVNYPALQPILLDSYVGSASTGAQAEAVNIIPSVVGASLVGLDKSNQNGIDWVSKTKDFFNKANGQNVYLNGASSSSGSDWWYDLMPNIFFYQLYSLYPNTQDFNTQFTTVADRWLGAVHALGGSTTPWTLPSMDYRGFNLSTSLPSSSGVTEPESAGTIAWILYHAYIKTGEKKYLDGAQQAIGFLSGLTINPAYEIQLPYGTFAAAKMNAELGTTYDVQKMLNWSFDQSSKRNWGTVVGTWGDGGDINVSGLVGEIDNPATGYAFAMNGFEQAAALVPLVKYDKRFARTIGKWVLNLANASRLFYPQYLPSTHQDDLAWSTAHDPHSAIPYEALKQDWNGTKLYGTGDAKRNGWAQTNLGLYGGSHVGYLASLVEETDVEGVLLLDLNRTDFFGQNEYPSRIAYNPYGSSQPVTINVGAGSHDIYDAISEVKIKTGVSGSVQITIPANEAMLLVYLPAGANTVASDGKLVVGDKVVDYHYGYHFEGAFRVQSLAAADTLLEFNEQTPVYTSLENTAGAVTYNWYLNGTPLATVAADPYTFTAPAVAGDYWLKLDAVSGGFHAYDSVQFRIVDHIPRAPVITGFTLDQKYYSPGATATIVCNATGATAFDWAVPAGGGTITDGSAQIQWQVPATEGLYTISCLVSNDDGLPAVNGTVQLLVKTTSSGTTLPVAYYPFDGDVLDYSGNHHDGTLAGAIPTVDARGNAASAFAFNGSGNVVYVPNDPTLNFADQVTLSCWLKINGVPEEMYVLSHGSYEQRWKVSVVPTGKLRWTIRTSTGTKDLDSSFPLAYNQYYHFAFLYTGYSMEMYVDGVLDTYLADAGTIHASTKEITFGQKERGLGMYYLRGSLDEIRIYDKALEPDEIATLKTVWCESCTSGGPVTGLEETADGIQLYPNPASGILHIKGVSEPVTGIELLDVTGRAVAAHYTNSADAGAVDVVLDSRAAGMMVVKISTQGRVVVRKVMICDF